MYIFANGIYSHNSSWIKCHMVSNGAWITQWVPKTHTFSSIFAQPLKMNDINALFIQIDINCKS
jgi:hypothetical protein